METNNNIHGQLYRIALAAQTAEKVFEKKADSLYSGEDVPKIFKPLLTDGENMSVEGKHTIIIGAGAAIGLPAAVTSPVAAAVALPIGGAIALIGGAAAIARHVMDKKTENLLSKQEEMQNIYGNALEALRQVYTGQINLNDHNSAEEVITKAVENNREAYLQHGGEAEELDEQFPIPNHENFAELHVEAQNLPGYEEAQIEAADNLQNYTQIMQRNGDYATPGTELENLVAEGQNIVKLQIESLNTQPAPTEDLPQQ